MLFSLMDKSNNPRSDLLNVDCIMTITFSDIGYTNLIGGNDVI